MHRSLPAERVEPLVGRPPGVFGHWLGRPRLLGRTRRGPGLHRARRSLRNRAHARPRRLGFLGLGAPPPRAGRHRGRPKRAAAAGPCAASPEARLADASPRMTRSSFWAGTGNSSIRGIRCPRFAGRSGVGGMKAVGAGGSWAALGSGVGSGNSDGFGCIGRIVTSSMVIGSTAAATAALAAFSIASWPCARAGAGCGSRGARCVRSAPPAAAGRRAASG